MRKTGTMLVVALLALAASRGSAEDVATAATPRVVTSGTLKITLTLTASADLPEGTLANVNVFVLMSDDHYSNESLAAASGTVKNHQVKVTMSMPFTWLSLKKGEDVTIAVNVQANANDAEGSLTDSSSFTDMIKLPADGKTTAVHLTGTI